MDTFSETAGVAPGREAGPLSLKMVVAEEVEEAVPRREATGAVWRGWVGKEAKAVGSPLPRYEPERLTLNLFTFPGVWGCS